MIRHVIRQERQGGFWLIRDEGRTIELSDPGYRIMANRCRSGGPLDEEGCGNLIAELSKTEGPAIVAELARQRLDQRETWPTVRHVPCSVSLENAPKDAVIAPKRIYFELTRACNLRCLTCFNKSGRRLPDELTVSEILDVNRQAHELGVFEIRYTGGECTLLPYFPDVVADARSRGFYISLGTNGVFVLTG